MCLNHNKNQFFGYINPKGGASKKLRRVKTVRFCDAVFIAQSENGTFLRCGVYCMPLPKGGGIQKIDLILLY